MDTEKLQAIVIEPLRNFAALLADGGITGEQAGELLGLVLDGIEARVEQGVGRVLSYAGIPSKADVDALISRVDALSRQLRAAR